MSRSPVFLDLRPHPIDTLIPMNRRRPWHQRLVRKMKRHLPAARSRPGSSPMRLFVACNLLGCFAALMAGVLAVALVLAVANVGCLACQFRRHSDLIL